MDFVLQLTWGHFFISGMFLSDDTVDMCDAIALPCNVSYSLLSNVNKSVLGWFLAAWL